MWKSDWRCVVYCFKITSFNWTPSSITRLHPRRASGDNLRELEKQLSMGCSPSVISWPNIYNSYRFCVTVGVLLRCGWRQWQLTYHSWTGAVLFGPPWSTLLHSGSRESKPQSITCYDHQDLLRQVKTWSKRKPKVKKCKSAFGKNYLGECVAQAKVNFWHFCSVSDCEDCDLCNNAGISLPVSPASPRPKMGCRCTVECLSSNADIRQSMLPEELWQEKIDRASYSWFSFYLCSAAA